MSPDNQEEYITKLNQENIELKKKCMRIKLMNRIGISKFEIKSTKI